MDAAQNKNVLVYSQIMLKNKPYYSTFYEHVVEQSVDITFNGAGQ